MKRVTAVIDPHTWEAERAALERAGTTGMTVREVSGFGRHKTAARTGTTGEGEVGDGMVCVLPVHEVVRVRTGDRDGAAL